MTGFGKAECELPGRKISIEIKSLNSKQSDINTRMPAIYREKEMEIRNLITSRLIRGKIDFSMHYELLEGASSVVNEPVVSDYFRQLSSIASQLNLKDRDALLPVIMRFPDAIISEKETVNESEWGLVLSAIEDALKDLDAFRLQEGNSMENDFHKRIASIKKLLEPVAEFESERKTTIQTRLKASLDEASMKDDIDINRFEQEMIYYLEKIDITEEKVRLTNHLEYFEEVLKEEGPNGKKLGFISQEIGREINTLGSKANHAGIQRLVVEMKDELEKIKEQVLNVL